jgi:hypothetical protein
MDPRRIGAIAIHRTVTRYRTLGEATPRPPGIPELLRLLGRDGCRRREVAYSEFSDKGASFFGAHARSASINRATHERNSSHSVCHAG